MRVYLHSLGCRLNWSEIEAMARRLTAAGHILVDEPTQADLCIVNTCAVTAEAERKTRHAIRALHRAGPQVRIAAVGCATTLSPETFAKLPGVAWVVPNEEKEKFVEQFADPEESGEVGRQRRLRTRAFIKVQDGCDNHCTYCVVRLLRGPGRSRPLEDVLTEVQERVQEGYREVVLTGVNLGSYGRDRGMEHGLHRLVEAVLT
ncbi:MAG TPA: radical SAM protein, partial [Anaerolineales bacterium]|nr:radical SAM protein [Anaerolineales bacterium]